MKGITRKTALTFILALLALAAAVALAAGLWYFLGVYESRFRAASEEIAYREQAKQHALALAELMADTAGDRAALERYVLAESDLAAFLSETERIGRLLGLTVRTSSVAREAVRGSDLFQRVKVSFEFSGSLDQVERMIGLFASFPYEILVERAALDRVLAEEGEYWRATVHVAVTAHK